MIQTLEEFEKYHKTKDSHIRTLKIFKDKLINLDAKDSRNFNRIKKIKDVINGINNFIEGKASMKERILYAIRYALREYKTTYTIVGNYDDLILELNSIDNKSWLDNWAI